MDRAEPGPLSETPDQFGAFPRLSDQQIEALARLGEQRQTQPGEVLYRQGDRCGEFFAILDGKVAVVEGEERVIGVHGRGRFLGELGLICGEPAFLTAVVREPGAVLAVPVERLRELVSQDTALGDLILRAYLMRREILIGLGVGFRIVGSRYSPDTRRLREFATRNRLPHRWIDVEEDEAVEGVLRRLGVAPEETPVVIWHGRQVLRNPSNAELARAMGLPGTSSRESVCDLVIVGAGPAGLAAAVYSASEGLSTFVLDAVATGGQAGTSPRIENYLGFPSGISGSDLAERAVIQAAKFGARIVVPAEATALEPHDGRYFVRLDDGTALCGRAVVITTGARYRKLAVPRLEEFEGNGVYYAATQMEARLCRGQPVAIVGGGNSAGQATLYLARQVERVRLMIRGDDLAEDMSRYLVDQIERHPGVEIMRRTEVRELVGDRMLEGVVVEDCRTGERHSLQARALFIFIGVEPHVRWLADQVALDERGFILTGPAAGGPGREVAWRDLGREPLLLETSAPGVFAAGDVRSGSTRRVASAVGEGAMAVRLVHEHFGAGAFRTAP